MHELFKVRVLRWRSVSRQANLLVLQKPGSELFGSA